MSINYSQPTSSAAVEQAINANPSISDATQAAITQTLGLGPGVAVVAGNVLPNGTIQAPTGSGPVIFLTFDLPDMTSVPYEPPVSVVIALQDAPVCIFNTDRDVKFTIVQNQSAQSISNDSAQSLSVENSRLAASTNSQKTDGANQVFDRVIQMGNGNDEVSVLDNRAVKFIGSGGNDKITLSGGADLVTGGDGQDTLILGGGRDTAVVGWGVDNVNAGADWDTIIFARAGTDTVNPLGSGATTPGQSGVGDWSVSKSGSKLVITSTASAQNGAELQNVNFVQFGDGSSVNKQFSVVAVNNEGDANVARLYQSVLDRSADEGGVQFWLDQYKSGVSQQAITDAFLAAPESTLLTTQTNAQFINQIYDNAFGRTPDAGGYAFWLTALSNGLSRSVFVDAVTESAEAKTTITNVQVFTDWV